MVLVPLHLAQQVVNGLALGGIAHRPHLVMHRKLGGLGVAVDPAGDVFEVEQPEHIVRPVSKNRDAREPGSQEQRHRLTQRPVLVHGQHVGTRHHDLTDHRVTKLKDGVDHLAFPRLDEQRLFRHVDQITQLGLRVERAVAKASARGHRVAKGHEQSCHRAEHPA